ncbi:AarF/UbiB family protein [Streptomyces sp. NPDC026294]|uniref:ABC1 kinase family protein n=1 Tax=Streptomyces sp. NPDC026294 TaxID=3155362 RepID=UPI0033F72A5D
MSRRNRSLTTVLRHLITEEIRHARRSGGTRRQSQEQQRRAQAVSQALQELGPFYIKIGQMLSTRPDFVPEAMLTEFGKLHDQVTPAPFAQFEPVLARDLGTAWAGRFRDIDTAQPLGAASLAQVYRATLADGTPTALKIQRPGVDEAMARDMASLRRLARLIARLAPRFTDVIDLPAMLGVLFEAMSAETDFRLEAQHMHQARRQCEDYKHLAVPDVLFATEHVLAQSLAPGTSIRDADPSAFTTAERTGIGADLISLMYQGYFLDRFFHADPHPGNIFVAPGQRAHLIDWGMVGRMESGLSRSVMLALLNVASNDANGLAKAWIEMGQATPWADPAGFSSDLAGLVPKIASASLEDLNFGVTLTAVLTHATRRGIKTSPVISLLGKSFANLEGSVRHLCPELSITDVFEENLRTILFGLASEAVSEKQAARTALELTILAPGALGQTRDVLRNLSNHDLTFHAKVATEAGKRSFKPDPSLICASLLLAAAIVRSTRNK